MKNNKITTVLLFTVLSLEVICRYFGLNTYPLYIKSKDYEYALKPNQNTVIYRNKFITNEYFMRSASISSKDTSVILLIGDSVVNGGNLISHENLASTILENELTKVLKRNVRVLNISAKSWGPDNAAAFIKKYGLFNADIIFLIVSSHDAFDTMTFSNIVGVSPDHPDKNTLFATHTLLKKIYNRYFPNTINEIPVQKKWNTGFNYFKNISKFNNIPIYVYLHSTKTEQKAHTYENGGKEIIKFCNKHRITVIKGINFEQEKYYFDDIHMNDSGQLFLSKILFSYILENKNKL